MGDKKCKITTKLLTHAKIRILHPNLLYFLHRIQIATRLKQKKPFRITGKTYNVYLDWVFIAERHRPYHHLVVDLVSHRRF
jgi:hypothetical protein